MLLLRHATLSAIAVALATPAAAISPEELWSGWKEFLADSYGATVEIGNEQASGETLTVTEVTITSESEDGSFEAILDEIVFENIGDGQVRITLPEEIPIGMAVVVDEGESGLVSMTMGQPGASLTASGTVEDTRYDFDYPTVTLGDFDMVVPEAPQEDVPVAISMEASGLSGFVTLSGTDVRSYSSETRMAGLTFDVSASDIEGAEGESFEFSLSLADVNQVVTGSIGSLAPGASLSELIASGTTQDGRATHGPVTYSLAVESPEGTFNMAAAAENGELTATMDEDGLSYGTTTRKATATIGGSSIPLPPIALSIEETGGLFRMPLVPGPDAQDFQLVTKILGLTADDMLWSIFDPAGALPRDAANLVIDITGSGVLIQDFTDPAFSENPEEMEAPGELQSLTVNELLFSIAGAELKGVGDFTFSNDTGVPMPSGKATISLAGANRLIDTLVGMGLLPEEQAMGARMMMGLFARPDGEDKLVSEIEVTEDGQILANGQRIR